MSKGRLVAYAVSVNIGMGGALLSAPAPFPIGSHCKLNIPVEGPKGMERILAEGTVVRSDTGGTAFRFLATLEKESFDALILQTTIGPPHSMLGSYLAYFRVGRSRDLVDCEQLLGVSKRIFRISFYISFFTSIPLAILPVWILRNSLPSASNWVYIALSLAYGALWLGFIQPVVDLTVFRFLRQKQSAQAKH